MMGDAKFSEAKSSFEKAERLIKSTKRLWAKNTALGYSGKTFSNIAKALYIIAESRAESDTKKFIEAKNLLASTSKYEGDAEITKLLNQAINFFDKSAHTSIYSNEFKNIFDSIDKNIISISAKIIDKIIAGGHLPDKLSVPMGQIKKSNELIKQFIIQGFAIILMVIGIYAQQNLILLFALTIIGILLFNIGLYLTLKKA